MSSFTTPIVARMLACGKNFELVEGFEYYTFLDPKGKAVGVDPGEQRKNKPTWVIRIPKGLVTDFASVPSVLWSVAPPIGLHSKAAVVHDYLYIAVVGTRKWADKVFFEAMKAAGVGWFRRNAYYYAVRLFGGFVWRRYKAMKEAIDDREGSDGS